MKFRLSIVLFLLGSALFAQTTANFESFNLPIDTFLNGSDGSGGFLNGNVFFPNDFNDAWGAWTGWSISTSTDRTTRGYTNQYAAITGGGQAGSATYATAYAFDQTAAHLKNMALDGTVKGFYITNATYPYWSMKEGDSAAKRFGGITGDDPDYFLLKITGMKNGNATPNVIDFYLADFRFTDNSADYIIDSWKYVDVSSLGDVDSLVFSLTSSDVGMFGMNTPAYFCLDNFTTLDQSTALFTPSLKPMEATVYPNPLHSETLTISLQGMHSPYSVKVLDIQGRLLVEKTNQIQPDVLLQLKSLQTGVYFVQIQTEISTILKKIQIIR